MKKTLVIVIVIVVVLSLGSIIGAKLILPGILGSLINTSVNKTLDTSLANLDFTNAQVANINQDLSKNEGMLLQIGLNKGKLIIDGKSTTDSITGQVKYLGSKPTIDFQTGQDKLALFTIKSADQAGEETTLHLSKTTNARLDTGIGAGFVDVDLTDLDTPFLNIGAGAGLVKVTFSDKKSTKASLAAGAGKIDILIPSKSERRFSIAQGAGFSNFQVGNDYIKVNDGYQTKGYDKAQVKIDITIGQALGGFNINTY